MTMIRYPFAPRFVPRIQSGTVLQTFRPRALRHVRPGQQMRLVDDVRFVPILTPDPVCAAVIPVEIGWTDDHITKIRQDGVALLHLDSFARDCGYDDIEDMAEDFTRCFGSGFLQGLLIEWVSPSVMAAREVA